MAVVVGVAVRVAPGERAEFVSASDAGGGRREAHDPVSLAKLRCDFGPGAFLCAARGLVLESHQVPQGRLHLDRDLVALDRRHDRKCAMHVMACLAMVFVFLGKRWGGMADKQTNGQKGGSK